MKILLARLIETKEPVCAIHYSKELDDSAIFWAVDEYTSPHSCEIKIVNMPYLGAGISFGWREQCEFEDSEEGDGYFSICNADLGEEMLSFLYEKFGIKRGWKACPDDKPDNY